MWARAIREGRILFTMDKGLAARAVSGQAAPRGIVLIRVKPARVEVVQAALVVLLEGGLDALEGRLTVLGVDGRVRTTPLDQLMAIAL